MFDAEFIREMAGMGVVLIVILGIVWVSDRGLNGQ